MSQSVYFVHLIPTGGTFTDNKEGIFEFCRSNRIVGVGWAVGDDFRSTKDFEAYKVEYHKFHGPRLASSVNSMRKMKRGDLVWTRSPSFEFYLSEVRGGWHYKSSPLHIAFDILNTRTVDTWRIERSDVPKEISETIYLRAAQEIHNKDAITKTKALWNNLDIEEANVS